MLSCRSLVFDCLGKFGVLWGKGIFRRFVFLLVRNGFRKKCYVPRQVELSDSS